MSNQTTPNALDQYLQEKGISTNNDFSEKENNFSLNIDLQKVGDSVSNDFPTATKMSLTEIETYKEKTKELLLSIDDPIVEIDYLLKNGKNIGTIPTENISLIVSPPKSGKSTFVNILIASVLGCGKEFGLYAQKADAKVLHIDTEQATPHQQRSIRYIYNMCTSHRMTKKDFKRRYYPIHARKIRYEELRKLTETAIMLYNPDFVVIDGVAQMSENIMDQQISAEINDTLQAMAEMYKCAIICVIHTSKMKRDEIDEEKFLSKGALGTMLEQGMSDCFLCIKNTEGYFIAKHKVSRDEQIQDIYFERDHTKEGMPKPHYVTIKTDDPITKIKTAIKAIFSERQNQPLKMTDLRQAISAKLKEKNKQGFSVGDIEKKWQNFQTDIEADLFINSDGPTKWVKLKDPQDPQQMEFVLADPNTPSEEAPF